jgi:hypothetical protein
MAVVAVTALLVGCGTQKRVYVQGKYEPREVGVGASTLIKEVRWLSYGGETARARGMFEVDDCKPTYAQGHVTWEPTSFSVSYVGPCKGQRSYRLISIPIRDIRDYALQDC